MSAILSLRPRGQIFLHQKKLHAFLHGGRCVDPIQGGDQLENNLGGIGLKFETELSSSAALESWTLMLLSLVFSSSCHDCHTKAHLNLLRENSFTLGHVIFGTPRATKYPRHEYSAEMPADFKQ